MNDGFFFCAYSMFLSWFYQSSACKLYNLAAEEPIIQSINHNGLIIHNSIIIQSIKFNVKN